MSAKVHASFLVLLLTIPLAVGCCTVGGALLGGGAGTVVGGGAGLCCGKPSEGAAGGAAIGATAGGAAGLICDAVILSPFLIVSKVLGCDKANEAMTAKQIEQLYEAGVDDQVIITQVEQVGMRGPLSVKEIVRLKEKGVSSEVIQFAQQHPTPISEAPAFQVEETQESDSPQLAKSEAAELPVAEAPMEEVTPSFQQSPYSQPYAQPRPISTFFE